jgi:hypothetical protein
MNDNHAPADFDDEQPKWLWDIVEKHDIALRAGEPLGGAFVLSADACELVQELLDPVAKARWPLARIRMQLQKATDMLIDAERLASMGA